MAETTNGSSQELEGDARGGVIAGGCIGRSEDGLRWDCYIGQPAVDRGILTHDFLGEPAIGPRRG
jgi:hypothetical protein